MNALNGVFIVEYICSIMAFFVFDWTNREYILTVLSLVLLAIVAQYREFFLCEEKALTSFEKFCVWVGVMEKPTPCPGIEDLYSMAMEMGTACLAAVGTSLLPSLWGWTRSLLGAGIGALQGLAQSVKRCAQNVGGRISTSITDSFQFMKGLSGFVRSGRRTASENFPPEYKYFFFRNVYEQRGIIMFMREGETCCEIFVQDSQTKKMECVFSFPIGN